MKQVIVSDTGALISLEKIPKGFVFISKLYDSLIIPPAVLNELTELSPSVEYYLRLHNIEHLIKVQKPTETDFPEILNKLHEGEKQAISLALELKLPLLIEETAGRKVAHSLGLEISGIARQIAVAKKKGIIDAFEAKEKLSQMLKANRINKKIYDELLGTGSVE